MLCSSLRLGEGSEAGLPAPLPCGRLNTSGPRHAELYRQLKGNNTPMTLCRGLYVFII